MTPRVTVTVMTLPASITAAAARTGDHTRVIVAARLTPTEQAAAVADLLATLDHTGDTPVDPTDPDTLAALVAAAAEHITPCDPPTVMDGWDTCEQHAAAWPCPRTVLAWRLRGLDPDTQRPRVLAEQWADALATIARLSPSEVWHTGDRVRVLAGHRDAGRAGTVTGQGPDTARPDLWTIAVHLDGAPGPRRLAAWELTDAPAPAVSTAPESAR